VILIHPTDFTGKLVFHCHVIFHEDNGMMGVVDIEKNPSPAQVDVDRTMYLTPPVGTVAYSGLGADNPYAGLGSTDSEAAFLLYCHLLAATGGVD